MADLLLPPEPVERPREDGWGGDAARDALRLIADDTRSRAGFEICAVEALRADDNLEIVAVAGDEDGERALLRQASPLAAMQPVLALGAAYGAWTFVAEEWLTPEAARLMTDYGWVPDLPATHDPDRWRAMDMLIARVVDDRGHLRGLVYLDVPVSGSRPGPEQLRRLEEEMRLPLRAVLTALEREELSQQLRLSDAAREVVRAAAGRLGFAELLTQSHEHLVAGFRADDLAVRLLDDPDPAPAGGAAHVGGELADALRESARRAWDTRTVVLVEPGRVWGDDELDLRRDDLAAHLAAHGAGELVLVPVGAGPDTLGLLLVARHVGRPRWTESESRAALDVAHDLGRAVLTTRAHQRERELMAQLQRLDVYRAELLATVSHELKNPLGVIVGHVEMMEALPDLPAAARTSLRAMTRSAGRLSTVVDDLLLLSRMGDPDTPLERVPVDLAALLAEVADDEQPLAAQTGVTVRTAYDGADDAPDDHQDGRHVVAGDPEELRRLLSNLASNAVKYSRERGTVELSLTRDGAAVVVTVSDDGLGISAEDQQQLFTEFFRSTNPQALKRPGTGLGLAIVARIVARHGGRVSVDSELGRGTTFTVTLPA